MRPVSLNWESLTWLLDPVFRRLIGSKSRPIPPFVWPRMHCPCGDRQGTRQAGKRRLPEAGIKLWASGAAKSRATTGSLKPIRCGHRRRRACWRRRRSGTGRSRCDLRVRTLRRSGSTISKSPSTRIEPLLFTVIFVAAIFSPESLINLVFVFVEQKKRHGVPCPYFINSARWNRRIVHRGRIETCCFVVILRCTTSLQSVISILRPIFGSILRNAGIDFVGPGEDSAFEVQDFAEAGFAQEIDGFGGALAAAAMRYDFARSVEFVHAARKFAERDQFPVEIADLIFVRFAHVENEKIVAFVEPRFQFASA